MLWLNYFRIKNATNNLINQKEKLRASGFVFKVWRPATLSYLREYLGEADEIYTEISKFDLHTKPDKGSSEEEIKYWPQMMTIVLERHLDEAIARIRAGRILPQEHNFFCRIPLPNAIAILAALWIAPIIFTYSIGKDNGKLETKNQIGSQIIQMNALRQENSQLLLTIGTLGDSLASCITKKKD